MHIPLLRAAYLAAAMRLFRPIGGDVEEIALAIDASNATDTEAEWLAAIAYRESTFVSSAVGDHGESFCAFQVHMPNGVRTREGWSGEDLAADAHKCVTVALRHLRYSFIRCANLPAHERLAAYAAGTCLSARGRRLSTDRDHVRRMMFEGGRR
jgi:hypothetical protein